jgi:hypothetical protein
MKPACKDTHGLLSRGTCPWCDQPIVDGQLKPALPPREVAVRQWKIPAMLKALIHEDAEVRSMVVSNLMLHGTGAEVALPVLRQALINSEKRVRWLAVQALRKLGRELSLEEAERFEQESQHRPEDCALHLLLLGYYLLPATRSEAARLARQKHILWAIEHAAETVADAGPNVYLDPTTDGEAYVEAKQLWLKHVEADESNTTLLHGAADFFTLYDRELSEALLKKAQGLEPDNPKWSERLGHLYALGMIRLSGDARREAAARSFEELEEAFACEKEELKRSRLLPDLAKAALEAGQLDKAQVRAIDLLSQVGKPGYFNDKNGPVAIHYGNLVLGRLALRSGDREKAKRHLLESAKLSGSSYLCITGPNMTLAKELLELGERGAVVEFLRLCTNFWHTDDHRAEQWIYAIEHGQNPDFGPNLAY